MTKELTVEDNLNGEHPEFKDGDLLKFKLPNGEEIITRLVKEDTTVVKDYERVKLMMRQKGKTRTLMHMYNIELIKTTLKERNYSLPKYLKLSRRRRKIFIKRTRSAVLGVLSKSLNLI